MNTKYFEENSSIGLKFVQQSIKDLEIVITDDTTMKELHGIQNAITAYSIDLLVEKLKK